MTTCREQHIKLLQAKPKGTKTKNTWHDKVAALFLYKPVLCACGNTFSVKCFKDEEPKQTECQLCTLKHTTS
jgi:hypothetical protein